MAVLDNKENALVEKLISVNKNTKVVSGGKNMSFTALVVTGDKKGKVNYGIGKAREVADARSKASTNSRKKLMKVPLKEGRTVHHDMEGNFGACKVIVRTAPSGTGIISGGVMRSIFECLGVKDVVAKSIGSNNPYNVMRAAFNALMDINSPKSVADRRGKNINEIIKRRNLLMNSGTANNEEEGK